MKPELEKKLTKAFPTIFSQDFHFECEDGWYTLIYNLCAEIKKYEDSKSNDAEYELIKALQLKEKFAALVFYYNGGDGNIDAIVSKYYNMSLGVCEETGGAGQVYKKGYLYKTLSKFSAALLGFTELKK